MLFRAMIVGYLWLTYYFNGYDDLWYMPAVFLFSVCVYCSLLLIICYLSAGLLLYIVGLLVVSCWYFVFMMCFPGVVVVGLHVTDDCLVSYVCVTCWWFVLSCLLFVVCCLVTCCCLLMVDYCGLTFWLSVCMCVDDQ